MAGTESGGEAKVDHSFGTCCSELKEAITTDEFEPLITVGEDGVLYMSVGIVDMEDEDSGMVDHPVFFCPFCGKKLQSPEELRAKSGADA